MRNSFFTASTAIPLTLSQNATILRVVLYCMVILLQAKAPQFLTNGPGLCPFPLPQRLLLIPQSQGLLAAGPRKRERKGEPCSLSFILVNAVKSLCSSGVCGNFSCSLFYLFPLCSLLRRPWLFSSSRVQLSTCHSGRRSHFSVKELAKIRCRRCYCCWLLFCPSVS